MSGAKTLRRYWIRFDVSIRDNHAPGTLLEVGVTAFNIEDALELIRDKVYERQALPAIAELIEDVANLGVGSKTCRAKSR